MSCSVAIYFCCDRLPWSPFSLPFDGFGDGARGLGDVPRLRIGSGERLGDRLAVIEPFSFSGDGDEPPVAEFRRDGARRTQVSR